jgi:hypothetical protein
MLPGIVTDESLNDILRDLSQKQRNGILSLDTEEGILKFSFQEGRIIGVQKHGESAPPQICKKLHEAGYLSSKVVKAVNDSKISVGQLRELLVGKGYVIEKDFVRAKHTYELDLLYSLKNLREGKSEFVPKVIRNEPVMSICVFPGTALLDVMEFADDEERFCALFIDWTNDKVRIGQKEESSDRLSDAERRVFDLTENGASPKEILAKSLLSVYEAQEALLALYDQDVICVSSPTGAEGEELNESLSLEKSDAVYQTTAQEAANKALKVLKEIEGDEHLEGFVRSARQPGFKKKEEGAEAREDGGIVLALAQEDCDSIKAPEKAKEVCVADVPEEENNGIILSVSTHAEEDSGWAEAPPVSEKPRLFSQLMSISNNSRSSHGTQLSVIAVTLVYLICCGALAPNLLDNWFRALSELTSKM